MTQEIAENEHSVLFKKELLEQKRAALKQLSEEKFELLRVSIT